RLYDHPWGGGCVQERTMMRKRPGVLCGLAIWPVFAAAALGQPQPDAAATKPAESTVAPASQSARYIRVVDDSDGHIRLQLSIRDFTRAGDAGAPGPTLSMAGAVHIADQPFYEALQKELDAKDVVLFEGVKPPGVGRAEHDLAAADDDAKASVTRKR